MVQAVIVRINELSAINLINGGILWKKTYLQN